MFSASGLRLRRVESARKRERLPSFLGGKIAIARTHRQSVGFAYRRTNDNFKRKIEIAHHLSQDRNLRRILLSEEGKIRLDDVEQFGDHRGHSAKMPRPRSSIKSVADALDVDKRRSAVGIHHFCSRSEDDIDALGLEHLAILFQSARIAAEILIGAELRWVHEDRDDNDVATLARCLHQGTMAGMQRAHGGHKTDAARRCLVAARAQLAQSREVLRCLR